MNKFFKKYLPFTKGVFLESLTYRVRFIFWLTFEILYLVISFFLWKGVYQSHSNYQAIPFNEVVIGSYTFQMMIMYVFFEKIVGSLTNLSIEGYISDEIKDGSISMRLIKPISYRTQLFFQGLGNEMVEFVFFALPFTIIFIGASFIMKFEIMFTPYSIIMFIVSIILGGFINYLISFLFGMILFLTLNSFGMFQFKTAIERILSGSLIPISLFPTWLKVICDIMPFAQTRYIPICFILGQYNNDKIQGLFTILIQLIWVIILLILSSLIWRKATKKIVVQGG